jgi:hypothetical protein
MTTINMGKRAVNLQTLTGTVAGEKKWSSTIVSGSGGGGYIHNGQGHLDQVKISSVTIENQEIFIRVSETQEMPLQLKDSNLAVREGHVLSVLQGDVDGAQAPATLAIHNHTTSKSSFFAQQVQRLLLPTAGSMTLCLLGLTICLWAFASTKYSPLPRVSFFFVLGRMNLTGLAIFASIGLAIALPAAVAVLRKRRLNKSLVNAVRSAVGEMSRSRRQ